jgi:hypothetical protein
VTGRRIAVDACMLLRRPPVSDVWLRGSADLTADPDARIATVPRSLAGQAARTGEDRLADGRTRVVLVVPDRRELVVAVSSVPRLARSIVDSASLQ